MSSPYFGVPGFLILLGLWLCTKLVFNVWCGSHTTRLWGPSSRSLIMGLSHKLITSLDSSLLYEDWAARYGPVFEVPLMFGRKKVVLTDPKAVVHFYNSERTIYTKTENDRMFIGRVFGRGVLWAEGEMHKRQRKALTPAFSNAVIRRLTSVFFDSAYKLKTFWDATLESSSDGAVIEVEEWMNRIALDSIGIAGFSHDFRYLEGQTSPVTAAFESLGVSEMGLFTKLIFMLSFAFPFMLSVPTPRMRLFWELRRSLNVIAERLLANTRREKEDGVTEEFTDKSVIGLLLKAELADSELRMTQEEVVAQNILLLAGYETTSVSLTWALIELSKHPEIQDKLRKDLARFSGTDPTWDQLVSELPYLDAVVQETLRLHPPVVETFRIAAHDDVIPLGTPVVARSGETISSITIAKGTTVLLPIRCINRSEALWGPDAKDFKPERWFEDVSFPAKDLQGHRHILTFHDGPRTCLGKSFALAEFKAALSVLIRNYTFELPDGPETKIETHVTIVPRPKVAGENGAKVPLMVRRVE
ncbi:Cytochrome P450 [Mycena venus]|uniref:Cytochrome P450 n=1 Tax=Mycena venus TaxID=2733690 RepID=A0A8H6WYX7_9AGAR|nr:Cytochrome P450 [Mycena venus]